MYEPETMISSWHSDFETFDLPFDLVVDIASIETLYEAFASIEFRYFDDDNVADFSIDAYGNYSFGSFIEGEYFDIIPWTRSAAITRAVNTIRIVDTGDRVLAFCNDQLLFNIPFEDISPGRIIFSVSSFEEGTSSFMFDNVVLREAR